MKESAIEKEFRKYKSRYVRLLGTKAIDNEEIDTTCSSLFGSKYRGTYPVDAKFEVKPGYYIINTDKATGDGIHWIGCYATKKTFYIFDTFARTPDKLVPILTRRLQAKFTIKTSDRKDKEQKAFYRNKMTETCGQASIAWLHCVHKHGIRSAMKI